MLGCNSPGPFTSISRAQEIANIVKNEGYAGVMTWSINHDTDHREPYPGCTPFQTGQPDGTYTNAISEILMTWTVEDLDQ